LFVNWRQVEPSGRMMSRKRRYRLNTDNDERLRSRIERAFAVCVFLIAGVCSFGLAARAGLALAQDLSTYAVVPQFGHSSAPTAIAIAPNGRWFATAKQNEIYLWDMQTGEILRRLAGPDAIRFLALSKDGALVLARDAANALWGWKAESGAAVTAAETASAEATAWNDLQHLSEGRLSLGDDDARKYLSRMKIDGLVPTSNRYGVMETNVPNVVEVDFEIDPSADSDGGPRSGTVFVDIKTNSLLAKYIPEPDDSNCGQFWGTFAFNGRMLVLAPTMRDASSSFTGAEVIDVAAAPAKLKWKRPCLDFMVAGIEMQKGLILASTDPTQTTVWDAASGQALAQLGNWDNPSMATSNDRRAIAYARMVEDKNIYGVAVLEDGAGKFFPTDRRVTDVRLSADGRTVFGKTEPSWKAWDVVTGEKLRGAIKPPDTSKGDDAREHSPDGKFRRVATKDDGRRSDIVDAAGRTVVTVEGDPFFSDDSLHAWTRATSHAQSVVLWDLKTGKRLWTATDQQGDLVMEFPDGRVRLSKGAEKMVRLVRGFDVKPFDGAAARRFLEP
jgi:hypothetical protein